MSRREDIETSIWSDPDFETLSLEASALYLWSFTNPRCGMAGIYKVGRRAMTESKVEPERLDIVLAELAAAGFAYYEGGVLWVRTRVKHLRTRTEQIAKSIAKDIDKIDESHPLRRRFLLVYADLPWLREQLRDLNVPDTSVTFTENGSTKPKTPNLTEVRQGFLGKGSGKGEEEDQHGPSRPRARLVTFDRRPVPADRVELAERILGAYNELAGQHIGAFTARGKPSEALTRIIGALTDWPEQLGDIETCRRLIAATLASRWWGDGPPSIGVIFGPRVFESNVVRMENPTQPVLTERERFREQRERLAAQTERRLAADGIGGTA